MATIARPFLMFEGRAEEAMAFYAATFPGARIERINRRDDGKVQHGGLSIGGLEIMTFDSPTPHAFTFTPAISLFVVVDEEATLDRAATALVSGGKFLMPPDNYGFSRRFCWVEDRFGVSWQINVE